MLFYYAALMLLLLLAGRAYFIIKLTSVKVEGSSGLVHRYCRVSYYSTCRPFSSYRVVVISRNIASPFRPIKLCAVGRRCHQCCLRKTENDSSRQVIDLLNGNWTWMGNVVWFLDGHGWGWGVVRGWGR